MQRWAASWSSSGGAACLRKRHRGDSSPRGQSPMDFEAIPLAARAQCHVAPTSSADHEAQEYCRILEGTQVSQSLQSPNVAHAKNPAVLVWNQCACWLHECATRKAVPGQRPAMEVIAHQQTAPRGRPDRRGDFQRSRKQRPHVRP